MSSDLRTTDRTRTSTRTTYDDTCHNSGLALADAIAFTVAVAVR